MADVFISKSTKDDELALSICDILEQNGIDCWISNRDLKTAPGSLYAIDIVNAILESKAVLLILSHNSNKSRHVINEVSTACDNGKKVFALQIDDVVPAKEFDYYLSQEQRIIDEQIPMTGDFRRIVLPIAEYLDVVADTSCSRFVDEEYIKKANFKKIQKETLEKRQSYSMSIAYGNENEYDNSHFYETIVRLDVVDNKKNTWSSYRFLTIRNDTNMYTNHIVHKECGEDKAHFKDMRIRAFYDDPGGERLSVESMTHIQPNSQQVFKINFKSPLKPGESVTIFYRLDWPNEPSSYYKEELSQSISLSRYKKGVGSIVFGVFEPYEIISSHMVEVSKLNEMVPSNLEYQLISIKEEPLLKPLHEKYYMGVKYTIEDPNSILYQVLYTINQEDSEEDEEDFF